MSKFIIYMLNKLYCGYVLAICLICTVSFDNWEDRTIAITMTLGSACLIAALLNRVLPHKLLLLGGIVKLVEGPLLVIGAIVCLDVFEPWPMKIIGMFAWVIFMMFRPSFTKRNKE
ncbi:hypothetical protein ACM94E_004794 [Enterobacter cloacae]|uniref:hypothetical protein n=1 Tax=Enterobacter cloacae TaxID=550 RepID=UPI0011E8913F|nr:hypothetical protein [Enterobacter cloacae]VAM15739.1 Uncharacterised protein [Enterobacter kobei]MCK7166266.1 hypothetical protein [Enterobacter cloacae]MCU6250578.1 hypothetical protein [Enterobacter cloacae]TYR24773.1 hypothetical protein FYC79_10585 [Enterobacter cloacae]UDG01423.1 hypothetical protein LH408_02900 [Enterobacter cloacae]